MTPSETRVFRIYGAEPGVRDPAAVVSGPFPFHKSVRRAETLRIPGLRSFHPLYAWKVFSPSKSFSRRQAVYDQSEGSRRSPTPPKGGSGGTVFQKPLHFWIRLALGSVFIVASADKIYNPAGFAQAVYNYQILPDVLVNLTALILPWLEFILGILLIGGLWLPGAVTLANGLLMTFFGALLFNVARGLDVHCGCFSTGTDGAPATAWSLIRDAAFLLMGGYLFFKVLVSRDAAEPGKDAAEG